MNPYSKEKQAIPHGNRMAEIGAQTGAQLKYLEATQNATTEDG